MAHPGCALWHLAPMRTLRVVTLGRTAKVDPEARDAGTGGFTLLELMVVIVVIGILAGIVLFGVGAFRSDARNSACRTDVRTLQTANAAYVAKVGTNAPDIAALVNGGYIHSAPESGVTFANGVTNPASMDACTGELAFTPDPPSSVPSGSAISLASASGTTFHPDHGDDFTATLQVTVTDQADVAVMGAVVAGSWSDGASDAGCTTAADGTCSFTSAHSTPTPAVDVTWSLVSVTKSGYDTAPGSTATVVCSRTGNPDDTRSCDTAVTV